MLQYFEVVSYKMNFYSNISTEVLIQLKKKLLIVGTWGTMLQYFEVVSFFPCHLFSMTGEK